MKHYPLRLLSFVTAALLAVAVLSACGTSAEFVPEPLATFEFTVDPTTGSTNLVGLESAGVLEAGVDLELSNFIFKFLPGNRMGLILQFKNITKDEVFYNFSFKTDVKNAVIARAFVNHWLDKDPELAPGDQTDRLGAMFKHEGEPFGFYVEVHGDRRLADQDPL